MLLSKKAARVLAIASTFAFTLTGMSAAQPAKVQAAVDQAPTVKVLGATLRLDGESGKQSLRFGIEVSNASNAEACGIDITYKGKTVTVGTDVDDDTANGKKKHTAVYSKDEANDKIVYSAVITGIPKANYSEAFSVKGYVKEKVALENKGESIAVNKSVTNVVDSLKKQYPEMGLELDETTGNLMKTVDGSKVEVAQADFGSAENNGNVAIVPEGTTELDLSSCLLFDDNIATKKVNEDGSVTFTKNENQKIEYVGASLPYSLSSGSCVNVTVKYACTGVSNYARVALTKGLSGSNISNNVWLKDEELSGVISGKLEASGEVDAFSIKANSYNTSFDSITIKSIVVEACEVVAPVDAPKPGFNEEGTEYTLPINSTTIGRASGGDNQYEFNTSYNSVKITRAASGGYEISIQLPKDIYSNTTFCKAIITYKDATKGADFGGYVAKYDTENMGWSNGEENDHKGWNNTLSSSGTLELTANNPYSGNLSGFRIYGGTGNSTLTITSVVFVKAEDREEVIAPAECVVDFNDSEMVKDKVNGVSVVDNSLVLGRKGQTYPWDAVKIDVESKYTQNEYSKILIEYEYTTQIDSAADLAFGKYPGTIVVKLNDASHNDTEIALDSSQTSAQIECSGLKNIKLTPWSGDTGVVIKSIKFVSTDAASGETTP